MYETGLDKNAANFTPLTPIDFLVRAAEVYPDRTAVIHGAVRRTWRQTHERCVRLASALVQHGIRKGDTVAAMLPNIPAMVEAHFGVPMSGAVLNTLNTRLDAEALAFMLDHGEAKAILVDREFAAVIRLALVRCQAKPLVIDVDDPEFTGAGNPIGSLDYEAFLAGGDPNFAWQGPADEWDAICLNYTPGPIPL